MAYAGYAAGDVELFVGGCCYSQLSELASHIYWWWTDYKRPKPETPLWRYLDFSKFVALLKDRTLHFARADLLGDPFEGALGLAERQDEWRDFYLDFFRQSVLTVPGQMETLGNDEVENSAQQLYEDFKQSGQSEVQHSYVSCWHTNNGESEALWRLYCPPPTNGVALHTSFKHLEESLDDSRFVKFGFVQYIDFSQGFAGTYDRIFWKRASLSHEAEIRGVITKDPFDTVEESYLSVPLNLSLAITEIVTSPFAPDWFEEVIKDVLAKYGVDITVRRSNLFAEPFF